MQLDRRCVLPFRRLTLQSSWRNFYADVFLLPLFFLKKPQRFEFFKNFRLGAISGWFLCPVSAPRFLSVGWATAGRGTGALAAGRRGDNYIMASQSLEGGIHWFNYMYVCVRKRMFPINASRWQCYYVLHILKRAHWSVSTRQTWKNFKLAKKIFNKQTY